MKHSKILLFSLVILCLLSFATYSGNIQYWFVDFISHFTVQYAFLALLLFGVCLWKRVMYLIFLSGLLCAYNVSAVVDFERPVQESVYVGNPFKVYSVNVNMANTNLLKLTNELEEIAPDIILLLEVKSDNFEQIRSVIQTFPYSVEKRALGKYGVGFVLLSKFPILDNRITVMSDVCNFVIEAQITIDQKPVMFYGVHARRPDKQNFIERKKQFLWLARQISSESLPVIVAGDFNATPYSPIFRELLNMTGLKDSRKGFGWQPSWPTSFPPLMDPYRPYTGNT